MTTNTFFVSDNHFFHKNIQRYCPKTRFGKDVEEMNELMIAAHNAKVPENGTVYFLGDFSFGTAEQTQGVIRRLNGHKHLIYGNHDKIIKNDHVAQRMFESVQDYKEINVEKTRVILFHFPMREWNQMHRGSYHLFGHVHGGFDHQPHGRSMDVGIDTRTDMAPWSWEEVHRVISKREVLRHVHGEQ